MKSLIQSIDQVLQKRAMALAKISQIVNAALPLACQNHVNVAGIRDNQLILITDSPVWASKLRLYRQHIIQILAEHGGIKISNILIKQSNIYRPGTKKPAKRRHLDTSSARLIRATAASISDPALQQALNHLADNTDESE